MAILIVAGFVTSFFISETIKENSLHDFESENAAFVLQQSKLHLDSKDFTAQNFDERKNTFTEFFKSIDTSEIVRIKVWSTDGTIVYSDDDSIVGENFGDNPYFLHAMTGDVSAEIQEPEKPENISELGYGQLIEVYVPITDDAGNVFGVIETYTSMDYVLHEIDAVTSMIHSSIGITIALIGVVVTIVFFNLRKNIINPIVQIQQMIKNIADGNFDQKVTLSTKNELEQLVKSFDDMRKSLQKTIELEKQLAVAQQNVKNEKLVAMGSFASRLAHDFRNPLSSMKMSVDLLERKYTNQDEDFKKYITVLNEGIARMSFQIDEVLNFVRTQPLKIRQCSAIDMFQNVINSMDLPNSVKIVLPDEDISLKCDDKKMEIVFVNLITNAIHAMDNSGTIDIRLFDKVEKIMIEIQNTGPSIPDDVMPHIFEPLFTTKQIGTGLGLVSCQTIVEQHGGTIHAYNNPTRFVIHLPKNTTEL